MKKVSKSDTWLVEKFYVRYGDGKSKLDHPPMTTGMYQRLRESLFGGGLPYDDICRYWKDFKRGIKKEALSLGGWSDIDHNMLCLFRDYILWKRNSYSFSDLENATHLKVFFQKDYRDEVIEFILKDKI